LIASAAKADVITARVTSDAEEHLTAFGGNDGFGSVDLTSSDLELISEGNGGLDWQAIGLQFTGLGIARGSLINSAAVTFTIDPGEVGQAGNLALTIFGELTPNAVAMSATNFNLSTRLRTASSVSWNLSTTNPATGQPYVNGQLLSTPDISNIFREIIGQTGWDANNQLSLLIFPNAFFTDPAGGTVLPEIELRSLDFGEPSAPLLSVDFTAVPEPSSFLLIAVFGIFAMRGQRFKKPMLS